MATPEVVGKGLPVVRSCLAEGCDLDIDVLPELADIRRKLERKGQPLKNFFGFVGPQIRERRDRRLATRPPEDAAIPTAERRPAASPLPTPIDPTWAPKEEDWRLAADLAGEDAVAEEIAIFVDRKKGSGERKVDWDAEWRAWVRTKKQFVVGRRADSIGGSPRRQDVQLAAFQNVFATLAARESGADVADGQCFPSSPPPSRGPRPNYRPAALRELHAELRLGGERDGAVS